MTSRYTTKTLACAFDDAVARTTEALESEGLGVITQIDMRERLSEVVQ